MNQYINSRALEKDMRSTAIKSNSDGLTNGMQFHLVMQQVGLGIPVDGLLATYPQLKQWVDIAFPYTQIPGSKSWNVDLCHEFNGVYLIENYDFIVSNDDKTIAIDWTIGKPHDFQTVEQSWKTQLRLFLLHQNTGVQCENISLVYLKVNSKTIHQCCYSAEQHEENKQKLSGIITPVEEVQTESQSQVLHDPLVAMHEDWLASKIDIQEYFNAIPEVKL